MAVLATMIKASDGTKFAAEVTSIISKGDRVLKGLDLDYRGGEGVYEVDTELYEVQLVGALEDSSDKAVNSIKRAVTKALNSGYDALVKAFENFEGVKCKVSLAGVEVEEADDPDFADAIVISLLFNGSVGVEAKRRGVKAKRIKAKSDLETQWDKILPKAEKALEKYLTKDASKEITTRFKDAFLDYVAPDYDFDSVDAKVTGCKKEGSLDNEDTRASFVVYAELTFKSELSQEEVIEALEATREEFSDAVEDDGHLVLEGYSPVTEDEAVTFLALEAGDKELPDDERKEELMEQCYEETVLVRGDYAEFGGGFEKIVKGKNGTFTVPVFAVFDWNLNLA